MRPSIRYLVFGPITKSASFWVEIGLIAAAAQSLGAIWHHISKSIDATPRATEILVFLAFAFFLGLYIYFVDLAKLKTQARAETDLAKLRILCKRADFRFRMFCGIVGLFVVGLQVYSDFAPWH